MKKVTDIDKKVSTVKMTGVHNNLNTIEKRWLASIRHYDS